MKKFILLALLLWSVAPARAQEAAPLQTVKNGELTLRVEKLEWRPLDEVLGRKRWYSQFGSKPPLALTVQFALEGAPPSRNPRLAPAGAVRVYLLRADGRRVQGEYLDPKTRVWNQLYGLADPRQKTVELEFEWRPANPDDDNRPPAVPLVARWEKVTIPAFNADAKEPQPLDLPDAARTLPGGWRLQLQSALVRARKGDPADLTLKVFGRWLPPLADPGACATIAEPGRTREGDRPATVIFDNGAPVQDRTHHIGIAAGLEVDQADQTPGAFTVYAPLLPGAKTVDIAVEVAPKKTLPPLEPSGGKRFRVTLPAPAIVAAPAPLPAPVATLKLGDDTLQLLPLTPTIEGDSVQWSGQLLQQTPAADVADGAVWEAKMVSYTPGGNTGLGRDELWLQNGAPAAPGQTVWLARPSWPKNRAGAVPDKATIAIQWERVKRESFDLDFGDLPLPAPGQIVETNATLAAGEAGTFAVKKIGWFTETETFSPLLRARASRFQPPYGLAVVVEWVPAQIEKGFDWNPDSFSGTWDLRAFGGQDSAGRDLARTCDVGDGRHLPSTDDLNVAATVENSERKNGALPPFLATFYLLPPTEGAKNFTFHLQARRNTVLERQTTTFTDVPLIPLPTP